MRTLSRISLLAGLLLLCSVFGTVFAQVQNVGSDLTLEVATWNIEWFGSNDNGPGNEDLQLSNAAGVILDSGIDLWALQEIADTRRFDKLTDELGDGWNSVLAEETSGLRMAFVYKTDVLALRSWTHILESFSHEFAGRPPIKAEFSVTLPDTTYIMTAITVHMKAFSDTQSYERREEAANRVKIHIDFTSISDDPVIFLGDFNDNLEGSISFGKESPYKPFIDDDQNYFPATLEMERSGVHSFCGSSSSCTRGSSIDHIIISSEFAPLLAVERTDRLSSVLNIDRYVFTTSDHVPVFAVFRSSTNTSTAAAAVLPSSLRLKDVYPNPFQSRFSAVFELSEASDVELDLIDVLGRRVWKRPARFMSSGTISVDVEPGDLPAGAYYLRIGTSHGRLTYPLISAGY